MVEGYRRVLNHNCDCLVELIVVRIKIDCLLPKHELLACSKKFCGVELLHIGFAVFHQFLRLVFGVENCQFSKDTNMSPL